MGKIAFLFSGQGAQYQGMGKSLSECSLAAAEIFQMADTVREGTSYQCFEASKEELSLTINTQPCVFCVSLAGAAALKENGIYPDMAAGFSLGEIAAAAFAGVLSEKAAFELVCDRAKIMHEEAGKKPGGMIAALKLEDDVIRNLCEDVLDAYPANFNCAGQVTVAGGESGLEEVSSRIKQAGGKVIPIAVSGAFHTPFMEGASQRLSERLSGLDLSMPHIPLYSNYSAQPYEENIRELLSLQVKSPVLWRQTVENMAKSGADTFIEVGPGKVLFSLVKKILPEAKVFHVQDEASLKETLIRLGETQC